MGRNCLVALVLGLLLGACAAEQDARYTRDGVQYGVTEGVFRGRWWSYYERGASFLKGGFHAEAAADFEEALRGRSRDSWRARTYGLHFVEYFPNRELGIAEYRLGNLEQAEDLLQRSLEQIDTERAHHYLDLVKKEQIAQGVLQDTGGPSVNVHLAAAGLTGVQAPAAPEEPVRLEDGRLVVAGWQVACGIDASDDTGVSGVALNGERLPQRGSRPELRLQRGVPLREGDHEIAVTAYDLAGNEVEQTVPVRIDLTGPSIGLFAPASAVTTEAAEIQIEGAAADATGLAEIRMDDRVLAAPDGATRAEFSATLALEPGANQAVLVARDVAGNETYKAVEVYLGAASSAGARLWLLERRRPDALRMAATSDAALSAALAATAESATGIRLKSPKPDRPYRHSRTLRVAGEVTAETQLAALSINGDPVAPLTGAPTESFNRRLPMDTDKIEEGGATVPVSIRAEDASGNVMEESFDVEVRPVELDSRESRMPVAVLAFAGQDTEPAAAEMLRLNAESSLLEQGRFRVLDRMRLQDVLTEQQLAAALADPNQAIAIRQFINAHVFLVGDVFEREQGGLELKARVISTETSDLLATLDVYIENAEDRAQIEDACANLAEQLEAVFPRLSGEVLGVRGAMPNAQLLVNWTAEDGIQEGVYLFVVHEEEPWVDEDTGEVLAPAEYVPVSRARVVRVTGSATRAETMRQEQEGIELEQGMPAITM